MQTEWDSQKNAVGKCITNALNELCLPAFIVKVPEQIAWIINKFSQIFPHLINDDTMAQSGPIFSWFECVFVIWLKIRIFLKFINISTPKPIVFDL